MKKFAASRAVVKKEKETGPGQEVRPLVLDGLCGGIDIGGTKISSALFTPEGDMSAREKAPIDPAGGRAAAGQVAAAVRRLRDEASERGRRLLAAGISVPGIAYEGTGRVWAPNIPLWDMFPLLEEVGKRMEGDDAQREPVPLVLDSDRSAYVLGEAWKGAAAGARDAVFLAVGTGIGAGILAGGRVVRGHESIAGAVGWFGLDPDFKPAYAEMGCFEAEASGNSLARKAKEKLRGGRASSMLGLAGGRPEDVTAEIVVRAARGGDPLASEIVDAAVTYLSMGVANIVSALNPEVVVVGGGLFQAADIFLDRVREGFRRWAQPLASAKVRIELSALGEDAGLFGCGRLAWNSVGAGPGKAPGGGM